jgi:ATP-dependent Clp protease ATP-binding subunit ClpA
MITLTELNSLAGEVFPGSDATLPRVLAAWAMRDPDGELSGLLAVANYSVQRFAAVMEPLITQPAQEDADLYTACVRSIGRPPFLGWHLLVALCATPEHRIRQALIRDGLDMDALGRALLERKPKPAPTVLEEMASRERPEESVLDRYGRELTSLAVKGAFDDLCDRSAEVDRLVDVLLKKQKGNGVLTGPAGVGKTALVELLARCIVRRGVPAVLQAARVFEISMGKLLAGTIYRGQFEQRLQDVVDAIMGIKGAILFIDEMHLIWGAGRAEGAPMDAANMLKPFLARGDIHLIGATTVEEYHQYIARDAALARRFEEIRLNEPDAALVRDMVARQATALSKHHRVAISDEVVAEAIALTDRYLPNRWQPDKSIDLLDASAVRVVRTGGQRLGRDDLLETLARQTGRPVAALADSDRAGLRDLAGNLKSQIIGQDDAIDKVVRTLIFRRQDLGSVERNLGTFLFAGESGVGKTELARSIARQFFGDDKALLHLDLAEYNEAGSVNRLIGSPPGFVGSEREGILVGWLHARPSGVILFDEIEKAHPDIHELLLGLLDNGRIRSARGEHLDTRQCVIVVTTNALTAEMMDRSPLGFTQAADRPHPVDILSKHFPVEFLNRFDELILFNPLGPKELRQILRLRLGEALARVTGKGICLEYDEAKLLDELLAELAGQKSNARGVARLLERRVMQPLSMVLLDRGQAEPSTVSLDELFGDSTRPQQKSDRRG